jgi:hypothetical protein
MTQEADAKDKSKETEDVRESGERIAGGWWLGVLEILTVLEGVSDAIVLGKGVLEADLFDDQPVRWAYCMSCGYCMVSALPSPAKIRDSESLWSEKSPKVLLWLYMTTSHSSLNLVRVGVAA